MGIFPDAKSFLFISHLFLQITVCHLNHMIAIDMIRCGGFIFALFKQSEIAYAITFVIYAFFFFFIVKISGALRLMDCLPSGSDKKALKRWFFNDKRVG